MDMRYGEQREVVLIITATNAVSGTPATVGTAQVGLTPPNRKPTVSTEWLAVPGFASGSGTFTVAAPGSDAVDPLIEIEASSDLWVRTGVGDDDVPLHVERINYS
jgi:hypothetical protein